MCHGDTADPATGKYADRLAEWKRIIDERLVQAETAVQHADEKLSGAIGLTDVDRLAHQRKLDDAKYNVSFVRLGRGVHNFNYAIALLSVATDDARAVSMACENPQD